MMKAAAALPVLWHFFWDFDGTLMDTYPGMTAAFCRMAAHYGVELGEEQALGLLKISLTHGLNHVFTRCGVDMAVLSADFRREEAELLPRVITPVPGIPEALRRMPGRHYLVTHRERDALTYLEQAGLKKYFTDWVVGDDGFPRKPAPDSLNHLVKKHGLPRSECIMIGDRPLDTAAGRNAGMLSCLLDTEGRFPEEPCDLRTDSALLLPELLCPQRVAKEGKICYDR